MESDPHNLTKGYQPIGTVNLTGVDPRGFIVGECGCTGPTGGTNDRNSRENPVSRLRKLQEEAKVKRELGDTSHHSARRAAAKAKREMYRR